MIFGENIKMMNAKPETIKLNERLIQRWKYAMRILMAILILALIAGCGGGGGSGGEGGGSGSDLESNPNTSNCTGPATQDCAIENGSGEQDRTCQDGVWSDWGACSVVDCDDGHLPEGNQCVATCSSGETRSRTCAIENGSGQIEQTCTSAGNWADTGSCVPVTCDVGYHQVGQACVKECNSGDSQLLACPIANGTGQQAQICSDDGRWIDNGTCSVDACDVGYRQDGNNCTLLNPTCSSGGTRSRTCTIENGSGQIEQTCTNDGNWADTGSCTPAACDFGYHQEGQACVKECNSGDSQLLDCSIVNGTGQQAQICSDDGRWIDNGACSVVACDVGFQQDGSNCVPLNFTSSHVVDPDPHMANLLEFVVDATGLTPPLTFGIQSVLKDGVTISPPNHVSLDASTGAFSWTPTPSQAGEYDFFFSVTDSIAATTNPAAHISVVTPAICASGSSACRFLQEKWDTGQAAGNVGDWYHNRDDFHSNLNLSELPQLDLMASGFGSGPTTTLQIGRVVVGNSSTAFTTGDDFRSLMRHIMLNGSFTQSVYNQYVNNNHYWYPESTDHDEKDHYHGKFPYVSSSQGSSGSEMDEVMNFCYTLAAFKPEVKDLLRDEGLLMPTLQMIFRRVRVAGDAEYLTGRAHPSAFDNFDGRLQMVEMANAMELDDIPPMIQLEVIEENYGVVEGKNEQWFTTPAAICRIFRGPEFTKRIVVSAENSFDSNNRPLTFHWVVLRGDPAHVTITPQNAEESVVEILIDYHPETFIAGSSRLTNTVEVGAFVHNGAYYSAPGFVTDFTLNNEARTYDPSGQLIDIQTNTNYVHPFLQ